jgi:hypothetical protein
MTRRTTDMRLLIMLPLALVLATHPAAAESDFEKTLRLGTVQPDETYEQYKKRTDELHQHKMKTDSYYRAQTMARQCRNNPDALIGLSADAVKQRCGSINYRVSRTVTAQGAAESWFYTPFKDGVLSLRFDAGVVTQASSY